MNSSHLEKVAESLIVHELMRSGLFVAKPLSDVLGADLIAFSDFKDGMRFCRIQCKGRSFVQARSHIEIPASYVDSPFMVVLYVALAEGAGQLFCFFSSDIRQWRRTPKGHFVLRFTQKTVEGPLQFYRFSEKQMSILKSLISNASDTGVFHEAVYGTGHGVLKFIGGGET